MGKFRFFSFWLLVFSKFSILSIFLLYTKENNETYFLRKKEHMLETF